MAKRKPNIGFVGLGKMGGVMAGRLAGAGHDLTVYDLDLEASAAFLAPHEGQAAVSLADLAVASDFVITCLPNGEIVRQAVLGEGGLAGSLREGSLLIDMSSSDPVGTAKLGEEIAARGIRMIDAPVSGGVPKARDGTLTVMCGGAENDVEEAKLLFSPLAQNVVHVGRLGAGQAMKALNNLCSAGGFLIALEVLMAGQKFGLKPETMVEVLNLSTGRNNTTENKIKPYILSRSFDAGFAMELMVKDIKTALGLAERLGTPHGLSAKTVAAWSEALESLGEGADHTELARWIEQQSPGQKLE